MTFDAVVEVRLREGVADPEGATIHSAMGQLGMDRVREVHVGRIFRLSIDADDAGEAEELAVRAAASLLANPVLEDYEVTVSDQAPSGATPR